MKKGDMATAKRISAIKRFNKLSDNFKELYEVERETCNRFIDKLEKAEASLKRLREGIENVKKIDEKNIITETMEMANYAMSFVNVIKELYKLVEEK